MSVNLLDFDAKSLAGFCEEIGEKPFRARQLLRWIHRSGEADFAAMSDQIQGDFAVIPRVALKSDEPIMLDGMHFKDLESRFDVPLFAFDFAALAEALESGAVRSDSATKAA